MLRSCERARKGASCAEVKICAKADPPMPSSDVYQNQGRQAIRTECSLPLADLISCLRSLPKKLLSAQEANRLFCKSVNACLNSYPNVCFVPGLVALGWRDSVFTTHVRTEDLLYYAHQWKYAKQLPAGMGSYGLCLRYGLADCNKSVLWQCLYYWVPDRCRCGAMMCCAQST